MGKSLVVGMFFFFFRDVKEEEGNTRCIYNFSGDSDD